MERDSPLPSWGGGDIASRRVGEWGRGQQISGSFSEPTFTLTVHFLSRRLLSSSRPWPSLSVPLCSLLLPLLLLLSLQLFYLPFCHDWWPWCFAPGQFINFMTRAWIVSRPHSPSFYFSPSFSLPLSRSLSLSLLSIIPSLIFFSSSGTIFHPSSLSSTTNVSALIFSLLP